MTENEMQKRNEGFMTAVGLLLMNSNAEVQDSIRSVLNSFGDDLHRELDDSKYQQHAASAGANPCPMGTRWDPVREECVPEGDS